MASIFLIGISFALFFTILLLNKKERTIAETILLSWLIVIAFHLSGFYIEYTEIYFEFPHFLGLNDGLPFLYGPFLFFYTEALISEKPSFKRPYWLHLIPFTVYTLTYLPFYFAPSGNKIQLYQQGILGDSFLSTCLIALKLLSGPVYIIWVWIKLNKHSATIQNYYSYTEKVDLNWLKKLTTGLGLFWLTLMVLLVVEKWGGYHFPKSADAVIFAFLTIFVVALSYYGLRQRAIYVSKPVIKKDKGKNETPNVHFSGELIAKYSKSGLTEEEGAQYLEKLLAHMDSNKPYLQTTLSVDDIANDLDIPRHHLSQIINQKLGKNFYQFVNQYRVEEAKRRLLDEAHQQFTLLAIAYDSGFNSKASFNTTFKNYTDMTPSQYRKRNLSSTQ